MENMIKPEDAQDALRMVSSSQAEITDRLITPGWYHPVLGLLIAAVVAAQAARSTLVSCFAVILLSFGATQLAQTYRRMTGIWITAASAGSAIRWVRIL